jgi:protein SCO1/2
MKPKIVLITICALALVGGLAAITLAWHHQSPGGAAHAVRSYQVHGRVRDISPAEHTIRIAHDEIPNYMPAMTMSLPIKESTLLQNLRNGDDVRFELSVTEDDSWISRIEKISSQSATTQTDPEAKRSLEEIEAERLRAGEAVPDFQLTDQDGRLVHLKDFRGKVIVLTFIYTRCPLPNFCPLMSKNFAELEQRLRKEFPNKYHLLSISMDPEFDRPEVLKEYAARYAADSKDWSFATGDAGSINFVAGLVGLYFEKENGLISHDLRTALIGPDGRLVQLWKSNLWTPYEIQRSVRETLTGHPDFASR